MSKCLDVSKLWRDRQKGLGDVNLEISGGHYIRAHWDVIKTVQFFANMWSTDNIPSPSLMRLNNYKLSQPTLELVLELIYLYNCFTSEPRSVMYFIEFMEAGSLQRDAFNSLYRNQELIKHTPFSTFYCGKVLKIEPLISKAWLEVVENQDVDNIIAMVTSGMDVNRKINHKGQTAVHRLVELNTSLQLIQYLIDSNADVELLDRKGRTILNLAVWNGNQEMTNLILKNAKSTINSQDQFGQTALHKACSRGFTLLVGLLLENGADWSIKSRDGYTPLHAAALGGHVETVESLLNRGVDISQSDSQFNKTALYIASTKGHINLVKFLISKPQTQVSQDVSCGSSTPLHTACSQAHHTIVSLLIENGADVNAADWKGRTPLHYAASTGNETCVHHLLTTHNCNIRSQDKSGRTALHLAAAYSNHKTSELLLNDKNCPTNVIDNLGKTALHYAIGNNDKELLTLLHSFGAVCTKLDFYGRLIREVSTYQREYTELFRLAITVR